MSPARRIVLLAALPVTVALLALWLGLSRDPAPPGAGCTAQGVPTSGAADTDRSIRLALNAAFAIVLLGGCLLALSLREHRVAYRRLQRMARRVVEVQEEERARWSRELHDGTGQTLVAAKLLIESAQQALLRNPSLAPRLLAQALERLRDVSGEIRRMSHTLRPVALDTLGLAPALRQLAEVFASDTGVPCRFHLSGAMPVADDVATACFRVAQEALANISKHALAGSVDLELDLSPRGVRMMIADDGRGFDVESVVASAATGIGLRNMRERLAAVGGRLELRSRPGRTLLTAAIPWKR